MATRQNKSDAKQQKGLSSKGILAGVIYVATALAILGFFWQSIAPFVLP